ncbi:AfsR/SARP family transcriptional regulator [Streptomyces sp. NPDC017943]|uniref:AfsR/SARP family transcriptional regulator n=1 Tax=Streptomyces sp. NPDC017943 TaxID=3365019 RepID=UPI00379C12F9
MRFQLLGPLRLSSDSGDIGLPGVISTHVVGQLLLARGDVVRRDTLIDTVWADRSVRHPVNALQVQVAKIRNAFGAHGESERLVSQPGGYRLALGPGDEVDVLLFEEAVSQGRQAVEGGDDERALAHLRQGLSLWQGEPLEDLVGPAFDAERARLRELRLAAQEDVAAVRLRLNADTEALAGELQVLLAKHPLREGLRALLMQALHQCGRDAEALAVFEQGGRLLSDELGAIPSPHLRDLRTSLLRADPQLGQGTSSPLRGSSPAPANSAASSAPRPPHSERRPAGAEGAAGNSNLRRPLGPFVGRVIDVEAVRNALESERLVTVVGPGGVGKTRLALEVCSLMQPSFDVWWVDLTATDGAGILTAVAGAVGLTDVHAPSGNKAHDYLQRIASLLSHRPTVVAFDNCEHVLDAVAPVVTSLLGRCPSLTVITTSREALRTPGEIVHPLDPMPEAEAAELFSARAGMIDPSFRADGRTRAEILELCRRLDGLPLAVELAAAHVRLLPVRQITERLDDRFTLLTRGERTAPDRHRTLRAVLDWSYALLQVDERRVLTELALYPAGCAPAEPGRTGLAESPAEETAVLQLLSRLADKSLLHSVTHGAGSRLRMLEMVRAYALARLREEEWYGAAEARFTAWACRFVDHGTQQVACGDQAGWVRRLTEENANIKAASDLLREREQQAHSLSLEAQLGYYWFISGREEEGVERLERALKAYDSAPRQLGTMTPQEEWALFYTFAWLAWLNHVAGRHKEAAGYLQRHEALWHRAVNPDLAVLGPCYDTLHAMLNGRPGISELFVTAESKIVGTRFHWDHAVLQTNWATYCLQHGDIVGARRHSSLAVAASEAAGDAFARAFSLTLYGDANVRAHAPDQAREQYEAALALYEPMGARSRWAYTSLRLACLDLAGQARRSAADRLDGAAEVADELGLTDLGAAVSNLRGVLGLMEGRHGEAELEFRSVWNDPSTSAARRAVAAMGLASVSARSGASRQRERVGWLDEVTELHSALLEPLAKTAISELLELGTGRDRDGRHRPLDTLLVGHPSVTAAFT